MYRWLTITAAILFLVACAGPRSFACRPCEGVFQINHAQSSAGKGRMPRDAVIQLIKEDGTYRIVEIVIGERNKVLLMDWPSDKPASAVLGHERLACSLSPDGARLTCIAALPGKDGKPQSTSYVFDRWDLSMLGNVERKGNNFRSF